jgi:hypothetical protein
MLKSALAIAAFQSMKACKCAATKSARRAGADDQHIHGRSIDALQPGDTLEVRVGPGHKGPHITEVLSADTSTATPTTSPRSSFRAATSTGESTSLGL